MTQQYLIGEMSVRLEELQAAADQDASRNVASLRHETETRPPAFLASAAARALALADDMCWDSLSQGDTDAFARQVGISAELRLFGVCAGLLDEDCAGCLTGRDASGGR
jgi:hypothetical protein